MLIVEMDAGKDTYLTVGETPYFLLKAARNRVLVCPDRCPHRGGPLHLGRRDCQTGALTCPWHEATYPLPALARLSVPAVTRGGTTTAVFDLPPDTPVYRRPRRITANDCRELE